MAKFYLELPSKERKEEALEYIKEFYDYNSNINGTGWLDSDLESGKTYEEWMENTLNMRDDEYASSKGLVPGYTWFLIREEDNRIIGMINFRVKLNDFLRNHGGHIGYSIRPTERRKGYNKINLYLCLLEAQKMGLDKVLLTCADSNEGSRKTILALGGVFERNNFVEKDNETLELYWIDVNDSIQKYKDIYDKYLN